MKKRGVGFGTGWQGSNYHFGHPDVANVKVEMTEDIRCRIKTGAADLGQGIPETLAVIVSKQLGNFPIEQIDLVDPDTGVTPDSGATGASRLTAMVGNAVDLASKNLAHILRTVASEMIDTPPNEVMIDNGVLTGRDGAEIELSQVVQECKRTGISLSVGARFEGKPTEELDDKGQGFGVNEFSYATYVAEVEVDTETGEVEVLRVDTFIDAGRVIRRMGAEMQVEGGVAMGLGHTLMEEFKQHQGWPETDSLTTYLIPTVFDVPVDLASEFVDEPVPGDELGSKGMAELALVPIAPAIVNAIYDAVGVYITQLPVTPERVLIALQESDGLNGEHEHDG
jgi:CO/xanthine dehydrogenase Mo-binding subunit